MNEKQAQTRVDQSVEVLLELAKEEFVQRNPQRNADEVLVFAIHQCLQHLGLRPSKGKFLAILTTISFSLLPHVR